MAGRPITECSGRGLACHQRAASLDPGSGDGDQLQALQAAGYHLDEQQNGDDDGSGMPGGMGGMPGGMGLANMTNPDAAPELGD